MAIKPVLLTGARRPPIAIPDNEHLYAMLIVLRTLLIVIAPRCQWCSRVHALIDAHPHVPRRSMGMPDNWQEDAWWAP